jgi:hypothetical protein
MARSRCRTAPCHVVAILTITGILVAFAAAGGRATSAPEQQTVEQLEAAVIMTFARFIEWSPEEFSSSAAPIVVGIIGDEAVAIALETIARGKNVAGRTMAVRRLQWDSEIVGVQMIFIGEPEKRRLRVVLDRIRSRQIVSVSALADFGRTGGMITLTFTDGRISFAVNSAATAVSGVRLSSFLLSHATKVSDESGGGGR